MDADTRHLLGWSRVAVVLTLLLLSFVMTVPLPGGRAVRWGGAVLVLAGVVLIGARLVRMRHPDHPLAKLAPELLLERARGRASTARDRASATLHRRRRRARVRDAELAALAAAGDDERMAPERIKTAAEALLRQVYLAWDARDRAGLAMLLSAGLLRDWERALDAHRAAGERHETEILDGVRIDLVGLTADASGAGSAIVLVEAELRVRIERRRGAEPEHDAPLVFGLQQYWTVSLDERPMIALAIEERATGDHHLREPIAGPRIVRAR